MNRFAHFVKKESLHILRDVRTILVVIGIPIVLTLLFGFAISTDVNNINVAACAPHRTAAVRDAVSRVSHTPLFTFKGYVAPDEIDKVLRTGTAEAVMVFADDYDRLVAGTAEVAGSGLMTPVESMPLWVQHFTRLLPPTYMVEIMRAVYLRGTTVAELSGSYLALTAFALALAALASLTYRKRG